MARKLTVGERNRESLLEYLNDGTLEATVVTDKVGGVEKVQGVAIDIVGIGSGSGNMLVLKSEGRLVLVSLGRVTKIEVYKNASEQAATTQTPPIDVP